MPTETAEVIDLASRRADPQTSPQEDDYYDDDVEIVVPATSPQAPRQQERTKRRSYARKAIGLPVYSDLLAESRAAQKRYDAAARAYQLSLQRLEAERFDAAETVDELLAQVAYLSGGRFDFAPWLKKHGYVTARQALLLLDLCASYGLQKPSPEVFPPVRRTAAQVDDAAQLKRLAPYLSPQARAALRRSR